MHDSEYDTYTHAQTPYSLYSYYTCQVTAGSRLWCGWNYNVTVGEEVMHMDS